MESKSLVFVLLQLAILFSQTGDVLGNTASYGGGGNYAPTAPTGPGRNPTRNCDNVRCPQGTSCMLLNVQCFAAPCPPIPECVPPPPPPSTSTCALVYCGGGGSCVMQRTCDYSGCRSVPTCINGRSGGY